MHGSTEDLAKLVESQRYNVENVTSNMKHLRTIRIVSAIAAGILCGSLGLINFEGLIMYMLVMALCSLMVLAKCGFHHEKYFTSLHVIFLNDLLSQLITFVFFWTLTYSLVVVY